MVKTNGGIQEKGAWTAAAISSAWLVGGVVGALVLAALGSSLVIVPALVAIGALAALPVSFVLGWKLTPRAVTSRSAFWPMTLLSVLLTDLELAVVSGLLVGLMDRNAVTAVGWTVIAAGFGLVIYGLPGLALAIPSAWFWEHKMRQRSNATAPAGGDRGSDDRLR
jgi:hypothetical protein